MGDCRKIKEDTMAIVINTNPAATAASVNLNQSNALLQKSLNRLSSGVKITSPADDAGGLAVSMKMTAALKRTEAVNSNIANAISFLQTQDGANQTAGKILDRISELKTLASDVTKSAADISNYEVEFDQMKAQLSNLASEKFNGVSLFGGGTANVIIVEDGTQSVAISKSDLSTAVAAVTSATDVSDISIGIVTNAIQSVATQRATNGAQTSRLQFASEMLTINRINLEAANSRIIDTDIPEESTRFAKFNILVQAGATMLAQANASSQVALRLLGT